MNSAEPAHLKGATIVLMVSFACWVFTHLARSPFKDSKQERTCYYQTCPTNKSSQAGILVGPSLLSCSVFLSILLVVVPVASVQFFSVLTVVLTSAAFSVVPVLEVPLSIVLFGSLFVALLPVTVVHSDLGFMIAVVLAMVGSDFSRSFSQ